MTEFKALTWAWLIHRQWECAARIAELEGRRVYKLKDYQPGF